MFVIPCACLVIVIEMKIMLEFDIKKFGIEMVLDLLVEDSPMSQLKSMPGLTKSFGNSALPWTL